MPGEPSEYVAFAGGPDLPADFPADARWLDGTPITEREADDIRLLVAYHRDLIERRTRARRRRAAQRRACALLRRHLSPSQAEGLRRRGSFLATLPSGNTYRLDARRGQTEEVARHGRRHFVRRRFCLHEQSLLVPPMPPADLALTHLLLLLSDERGFLALANATDARDMLWNGDWLRRVRRARLERTDA